MTEKIKKKVLDQEELEEFSLKVWKYKEGEMVSLMIHLGDRLGLYQALDGAGMTTAKALAEKTGLHERWLLEWLRNQAAAGLLAHESGNRFELTAIGREVLVNEESSLWFATGAFGEPMHPDIVKSLADAFRTGIGLTYQDLGPAAAHQIARTLGPWSRLALVPTILPALEGVVSKLKRGGAAADVGCGAGVALTALAEAFPQSEFHGYDSSSFAIEQAQERAAKAGVGNVKFHVARGEDLPGEPTFDFLITLDCIHDMTRPDRVIAAIYKALKPEGTWLIKDIRSDPDFEENTKNPVLAMMYGFSIASCLSSAMSEPDGMGLGTLGFNPHVARKMTREAGFSQFKEHDFDDPANLYYEVRP